MFQECKENNAIWRKKDSRTCTSHHPSTLLGTVSGTVNCLHGIFSYWVCHTLKFYLWTTGQYSLHWPITRCNVLCHLPSFSTLKRNLGKSPCAFTTKALISYLWNIFQTCHTDFCFTSKLCHFTHRLLHQLLYCYPLLCYDIPKIYTCILAPFWNSLFSI